MREHANAFLRALRKVMGIPPGLCTITIDNKTELYNMMKYLGFYIFESCNQPSHVECFSQYTGWDTIHIFIDMNKCFNEDGTFSELSKKSCPIDMLWEDWYDYPDVWSDS